MTRNIFSTDYRQLICIIVLGLKLTSCFLTFNHHEQNGQVESYREKGVNISVTSPVDFLESGFDAQTLVLAITILAFPASPEYSIIAPKRRTVRVKLRQDK